MAGSEAIAAVSRTLESLLEDRMDISSIQEADPARTLIVTFEPLDIVSAGTNGSDVRVNLFLYRVAENEHLKNQEIPGRGQRGIYGHPPLSLDLHYLMTTNYAGDEEEGDTDLAAQQILGEAMRVFHDYAIIPPNLLRIGDGDEPILEEQLREEFERIKITLQPMTLDDLSKIWAAFPGANLRRSVAYHVSAIQIESQRERKYPRPVGVGEGSGPRVVAVPSSRPRISAIHVIRQGDPSDKEHTTPYARIGDTLVLLGRNLGEAHVDLGDATSLVAGKERGDRLEIEIPSGQLLLPGPVPVRVTCQVNVGDENDPDYRTGLVSNTAVFMLVPYIESLSHNEQAGTITIMGNLFFDEDRESLILVGDTAIRLETQPSAEGEVTIALPPLEPGDYTIRSRVGGAESIDDRVLVIEE
ncbi:Pvc16 family protein [Candidatus Bipolaricaulota bacterium]